MVPHTPKFQEHRTEGVSSHTIVLEVVWRLFSLNQFKLFTASFDMEPILTPAGHASVMLFDAVVANDHEALITLYAATARNSLMSYQSMKSRWAQQQERYTKAGKITCFLKSLTKKRRREFE